MLFALLLFVWQATTPAVPSAPTATQRHVPDWLIYALLMLFSSAVGVVVKGLFDLRGQKHNDRAEIHKLLIDELKHVQEVRDEREEDADTYRDKYWDERQKKHDWRELAGSFLLKLRESVQVIELLLKADECLDVDDVATARRYIEEVRAMKKEPHEGERPSTAA